ncbi:MAG TPA: trehalase family glycosidase [Terriglobia bacterium]|nr:trehalase family glycosidase [Terriglobia bacterium]
MKLQSALFRAALGMLLATWLASPGLGQESHSVFLRGLAASRGVDSLVAKALSGTLPAEASGASAQNPASRNILQYISAAWGTLTRSMTQCDSLNDQRTKEKPVLYLPAEVSEPEPLRAVQQNCSIQMEHLPAPIHRPGVLNPSTIDPPGLLYLPNPYVVPGGMFNEMYGWDSYFILRGLLEAGRIGLAKGMTENFFYEIEHYGMVLNANRTYFLSRSQPPFLTSMILAAYDAEKEQGKDDRDFLANAYPYAVKTYDLWTHAPHLAGDTGLSRYYDFDALPAPEVAENGYSYYRDAAEFFREHPELAKGELMTAKTETPNNHWIPPVFTWKICSDGTSAAGPTHCDTVEQGSLTAHYYRGDRSMRESGFDVSFRFGPMSADTGDYADLSLNSLLYKTETDMARISQILGRRADEQRWRQRAEARQKLVNQYFWNASRGLYFDYDFKTHTQSSYLYATTFYPLWVGLAAPEQAQAVERQLSTFDLAGGVVMSRTETSGQWDYPYGWAPLQLIAAEGLRRYGFNADADRVSTQFISMVDQNYRRDGTIREKYNVVTRSDETKVRVGYSQNMVGFGWTNGVLLTLLHELPPRSAAKLELQGR